MQPILGLWCIFMSNTFPQLMADKMLCQLLLTALMVSFEVNLILWLNQLRMVVLRKSKVEKEKSFMNVDDLFDDGTSDEDFVSNSEHASEEESLCASDVEKEAEDNNRVSWRIPV
ncbi:hypothetical protein GLYMA_15G148100v4 [Glycine max]|nr:hypothetical protein GLYMA_15G148100v4 [Glycine max]KAH1147216.1 hypothetical protein GYH30_042403 [Glycine max]